MAFEVTAGEIALNIGLGIVSGVGGNAATNGLNQALSYVGLGGVFGSDSGPDYTVWFQKIAAQLATLQTMIEEANQSLQQVQQQLVEITQQIEESELQDILLQYSDSKNTINTYFDQYVTLLSAMADEQQREQAVKDMYGLLSGSGPDEVATAMSNIATYMTGAGELKSIINYQTNVCLQAITNWASNSGNYTMGSYSVGELDFHGYPARYTSVEIADNSRLITQSFSAAVLPAIEQDALPTFKAGLMIQAKGLLFLVAAWKKTLLESNLAAYNQNINAQVQMMSQFYGGLAAAAADFIRNKMRPFMVTLGSQAGNYVDDVNSVSPPYTEWLTWYVTNPTPVPAINPAIWLSRIAHEQIGNMVQVHSGAINPNFSFGQPAEAIQLYHFTYNASAPAVATVPDPADYVSQTPPPSLQSFLQSLPTATSETSPPA